MAYDPAAREAAFQTIGGFVILDALILNTDRHHENWAMLRETDNQARLSYRLAPSFDHASSLGRELTDAKLMAWEKEQRHVARYARKGMGGVYIKGTKETKGANPLVLADVARRRWPNYLTPWLDRLQELSLKTILDRIDQVPADCMQPSSRLFAANLVEYTYQTLRALK